MCLPCIDFIKMEPWKDGIEKVLIMMHSFFKFSVAVIMPYGISSRIHGDWGKVLAIRKLSSSVDYTA